MELPLQNNSQNNDEDSTDSSLPTSKMLLKEYVSFRRDCDVLRSRYSRQKMDFDIVIQNVESSNLDVRLDAMYECRTLLQKDPVYFEPLVKESLLFRFVIFLNINEIPQVQLEAMLLISHFCKSCSTLRELWQNNMIPLLRRLCFVPYSILREEALTLRFDCLSTVVEEMKQSSLSVHLLKDFLMDKELPLNEFLLESIASSLHVVFCTQEEDLLLLAGLEVLSKLHGKLDTLKDENLSPLCNDLSRLFVEGSSAVAEQAVMDIVKVFEKSKQGSRMSVILTNEMCMKSFLDFIMSHGGVELNKSAIQSLTTICVELFHIESAKLRIVKPSLASEKREEDSSLPPDKVVELINKFSPFFDYCGEELQFYVAEAIARLVYYVRNTSLLELETTCVKPLLFHILEAEDPKLIFIGLRSLLKILMRGSFHKPGDEPSELQFSELCTSIIGDTTVYRKILAFRNHDESSVSYLSNSLEILFSGGLIVLKLISFSSLKAFG